MLRLAVPFILLATISVSHAQPPAWVMQERERPDSWTITSNEHGYIYARVNGQINFGDRLRLTLNGKSDRCENAVLGTSWYIGPDPSNLANNFQNTVIMLEAFGSEIEALLVLVTEHGKDQKTAWVNIIKTDTDEMTEILDLMNQDYDTVEMAIKPTKSFRADQIFPSLRNSWSLDGSREAFGKARELCKRMVEDTIT